MTRSERRTEILASIEALKKGPATEVRDLKIRLLAMERDRIDDWQIVDHYQYRCLKLAEKLRSLADHEHAPVFTPRQVDEMQEDWRAERSRVMPACRHCGKSPLEDAAAS